MANVPARRLKPLADLVEACLGPALARQGFARADVIASWPEIVGERLAAFSQPLKIEWPRRTPGEGPARPANLVVRVEGAFALDMQHLAPLILERVNGFYGWRCVGRLVLKQGPVRRVPPPTPSVRELDAAERERISGALGGIADDALKNALARLGEAVTRERDPGAGGQASPVVAN